MNEYNESKETSVATTTEATAEYPPEVLAELGAMHPRSKSGRSLPTLILELCATRPASKADMIKYVWDHGQRVLRRRTCHTYVARLTKSGALEQVSAGVYVTRGN
jgi:hypothetical protein